MLPHVDLFNLLVPPTTKHTHTFLTCPHSLTPSSCTQRQWIRIVPVSEARCDYKGKSFNYFVYGYNTLVHAPEYPQQMCCGCSIV